MRKIEGDLKLTQEAVSDLERVKAELSGAVARKEKEGSALGAKIDDEATLASKYAKQAKELMARLEELDEELNIEEVLGQRLKRVAPCLKKTLKILDLVLRKLAQTQPLKLSLTRNAKQNLVESRLNLKN